MARTSVHVGCRIASEADTGCSTPRTGAVACSSDNAKRRAHAESVCQPSQMTMPQMHTGSDASRVLLALSEALYRWALAAKSCIRRERARQESLRDCGLASRSQRIPYEPSPLTADEIATASSAEATVRALFGDPVADYAHDKFLRAVSTGDMRSFKIRIVAIKARDALVSSASSLADGFVYGMEECIDRAERLAGCVPDPSPRRLSRSEQADAARRAARMARDGTELGAEGRHASTTGECQELLLPDDDITQATSLSQHRIHHQPGKPRQYASKPMQEAGGTTSDQSRTDDQVASDAVCTRKDAFSQASGSSSCSSTAGNCNKLRKEQCSRPRSDGTARVRSGKLAGISICKPVADSSCDSIGRSEGNVGDSSAEIAVDGKDVAGSARSCSHGSDPAKGQDIGLRPEGPLPAPVKRGVLGGVPQDIESVTVTHQDIDSVTVTLDNSLYTNDVGKKCKDIDNGPKLASGNHFSKCKVITSQKCDFGEIYKTTEDILFGLSEGRLTEVDALMLASALDSADEAEHDDLVDVGDDDMEADDEGGGCWRDDDLGWPSFYPNEIRGYNHDPDDVPDYY